MLESKWVSRRNITTRTRRKLLFFQFQGKEPNRKTILSKPSTKKSRFTTRLERDSSFFQETKSNTKKQLHLNFWQLRPPKISLRGTKSKFCETNFYVQESSIPILMEEAQLKVIKKTELEYRDESNDYAFFGFSVYLVSVTRKETQNILVEKNSSIESNVWTGWIVMHKTSLKTKQNHTQKIRQKTKRIFFGTWIEMVV